MNSITTIVYFMYTYSPSASQVLGAHTSRLSFPYGFNRQWYSSGLKQVCGYIEQFFSNALWFHSDEVKGQLSITETESAEGGQGSDIPWIKKIKYVFTF